MFEAVQRGHKGAWEGGCISLELSSRIASIASAPSETQLTELESDSLSVWGSKWQEPAIPNGQQNCCLVFPFHTPFNWPWFVANAFWEECLQGNYAECHLRSFATACAFTYATQSHVTGQIKWRHQQPPVCKGIAWGANVLGTNSSGRRMWQPCLFVHLSWALLLLQEVWIQQNCKGLISIRFSWLPLSTENTH